MSMIIHIPTIKLINLRPLLGKEGSVALRNRIQFIHSFYDRAWRRFFMSFATPAIQEGNVAQTTDSNSFNIPSYNVVVYLRWQSEQ